MASTSSSALQDRFGVIANVFTFGLPSDQRFACVVDIAAAVESTVYDTLGLPDHLVQGPVGDVGDDVSPHRLSSWRRERRRIAPLRRRDAWTWRGRVAMPECL